MKTYAYTYIVLRYVHDTTTREFVNVGVALYSPGARYASALCRTTYTRLARVFPGFNGEHFRSLMRYVQARFEELGERLSSAIPEREPKTILDFARLVLPPDDSSLQWSEIGSGSTDNPSQALERLFDRMVMRYEDKQGRQRRTEEDVWRHFKRNLEARHLLRYFKPKTIEVQDDELKFEYAWKNGVWHCLEPLSFDLATADSIRDKAHRWLGQITSVAKGSRETLRLYFLVGSPQEEMLQDAFANALSILKKIPTDNRVYLEQEADRLTNELAREVEMLRGHQS
jgi:Protein of unknown function (DUF3037)